MGSSPWGRKESTQLKDQTTRTTSLDLVTMAFSVREKIQEMLFTEVSLPRICLRVLG